MLGVISGPNPNANGTGTDITKQYQDIGITSVRNNDYYDDRLDLEGIFNCGGSTYPSWSGCDANDDKNYNWTKSDAQYQAYISGGFIPFLRLGGEWSNNSRPHDFKGPQNTAEEDNWIIAADKMVDRYEHWQNKPSAFTYLDLWTEAPGAHFYDGTNAAFIKFWVKAYKAIKAAHPELQIGGPGFAAVVGAQLLTGKDTFASGLLAEMYRQGVHLDWLGWHTFGTDPTVYPKLASAYQKLLDGTGQAWAGTNFFANTQVITDAYGNGSSEAARGATPVPVDTAAGTAILTAGWIALQYANIQGAFYYRGNDYGAAKTKSGTTDTNSQPGIFTATGGYKPLSNAFKLWSTLTNNFPTLLTTNLPTDGSANDVWALAASNNTGGIAVLVTNTTAAATTISLQANGQDLTKFKSAAILEVDDTHDCKTASQLTTSTISLPAGAVELIELTP